MPFPESRPTRFTEEHIIAAIRSQLKTITPCSNPSASKPNITHLEHSLEEGRAESQREKDWLDEGKEAVKQKLKDGKSARFKNIFFHRGELNVPVTCGAVNSRNSYGGYEQFVSAGSAELTYLEEEDADFDTVWNRLCQ